MHSLIKIFDYSYQNFLKDYYDTLGTHICYCILCFRFDLISHLLRSDIKEVREGRSISNFLIDYNHPKQVKFSNIISKCCFYL